jgi:hypothetical protein
MLYIFPSNRLELENCVGKFARPCPKRPRHGFVESRVVSSFDEVLFILWETLRADKAGEVIFMEKLTGKYSAVVSNAGATFGWGNDGVTGGGSGEVRHLPAGMSSAEWLERVLIPFRRQKLGIRVCPYVELVEKVVTVGEVLWPRVGEEMLSWEKRLRAAKKEAGENSGLVVWLRPKYGFSLFSHAGVHALASGVPVVAQPEQPCKGDTLRLGSDGPKPLKAADYKAIARSVRAALVEVGCTSDNTWRERMAFSLAVCHTMGTWGNEPHLLHIRGMAVVWCFLCGLAACIGEARHGPRAGPSRRFVPPKSSHYQTGSVSVEELQKEAAAHPAYIEGRHEGMILNPDYRPSNLPEDYVQINPYPNVSAPERDTIYQWVLAAPLREKLRLMGLVVGDFDPPWASSFGGPKWLAAAEATEELGKALVRFGKRPGPRTWARITRAANFCITAQHNGGRVLSKWVGQGAFCAAERTPQVVFGCATGAHLALITEDELAALAAFTEPFMKEVTNGK